MQQAEKEVLNTLIDSEQYCVDVLSHDQIKSN